MDKNRFLNYARYDLTIHGSFYRSLAMTTAVVMLAVTLMGFLFRWLLWNVIYSTSPADFSIDMTVIVLLAVMSIMHIVFFGCFNHPLRARQDRLKTLTLPVTNGERFLWHTVLPLVGGSLLLLLCLLLCDGLNALLSLLVGLDDVYSLTAGFFNLISFHDYEGFIMFRELEALPAELKATSYWGVYVAFVVLNILSALWTWSAYMYGNQVKYRYNLLWTTLALWLLQAVCSVILFIIFGIAVHYEDQLDYLMQNIDMDTARDLVSGIFWTADFLIFATGAVLWWRGWERFKKAQITTRLNR